MCEFDDELKSKYAFFTTFKMVFNRSNFFLILSNLRNKKLSNFVEF